MSARATLDPMRVTAQTTLPEQPCPEDLLRILSANPDGLLAESQFTQTEHERQLITRELEVARRIQQSLLPKTFPRLPGFDLAGFCHCARHVSGDFYDVLPLSSDSVLLVVADVMGKGVPAALFASTLRTLVRTISEWTTHPAELLTRMNRLMFDELSMVDMFITVQVAVADARKRSLVLANAGHCPLLLTDGLVSRALAPDGLPLGISADATFSEQMVLLDEFTCALLYTDGVTEVRNRQGRFFGQSRLESWLCRNARSYSTATQLKQHFLSELSEFQADAAPLDDQTFLLLVHGAAAQKSSD